MIADSSCTYHALPLPLGWLSYQLSRSLTSRGCPASAPMGQRGRVRISGASRNRGGVKMSQKSSAPSPSQAVPKSPAERVVREIRRATRKHHSAEDKIRIVLEGLRGEDSIAALCRREGIAEGLYYSWSKEFLEAGKRRLAGDTARAATTGEVNALRRQAQDLKEVVAEQALELRLLKKSIIGDGDDRA